MNLSSIGSSFIILVGFYCLYRMIKNTEKPAVKLVFTQASGEGRLAIQNFFSKYMSEEELYKTDFFGMLCTELTFFPTQRMCFVDTKAYGKGFQPLVGQGYLVNGEILKINETQTIEYCVYKRFDVLIGYIKLEDEADRAKETPQDPEKYVVLFTFPLELVTVSDLSVKREAALCKSFALKADHSEPGYFTTRDIGDTVTFHGISYEGNITEIEVFSYKYS